MKVPTIFTDMCNMPSGKAFCFAQQRIRSVKAVLAFSCGFSCQSVSSANTQRSNYHGCLASSTGTTGKTFRACMQFIALLLPILVWLEHISGLSDADRSNVAAELQALGCFCCGGCVKFGRSWNPEQKGPCVVPCLSDAFSGE